MMQTTVSKSRRTNSIVLKVVFLAVALIVAAAPAFWAMAFKPLKMMRTAEGMIGRDETALVAMLGQPKFVITADALDGRTVDYPWKGMNFVPVPAYPVRAKVYLYCWINLAAYVYINEHGIVEHVASAGT